LGLSEMFSHHREEACRLHLYISATLDTGTFQSC
jgi:hypothetical protein